MGMLSAIVLMAVLVAVVFFAVIAPRMKKQTPRDREILRRGEDKETGSHPMFP